MGIGNPFDKAARGLGAGGGGRSKAGPGRSKRVNRTSIGRKTKEQVREAKRRKAALGRKATRRRSRRRR